MSSLNGEGYRLSASAFFSIAVHGLILLLMTGVVLFPEEVFKSLSQFDIMIVSEPKKPVDEHRGLITQGNAQWSVNPGVVRDQNMRYRTVSEVAHQARDADYLSRWRDHIETFGTQYYQTRIKQQPLSGEVRILVGIGPKGELKEASIRQSSGVPALDAMAIEILKKAAPFEPLPQEIRADTDVLEIIRTWKFTAREGLRSG